MSFQRTIAITLRHFYLMRGSVARVLPLFIWIAIDMILWGFMTRYLNSIASPGFDFVPALLGAVLFWDFFIRVMQGVTLAFFEDVWSRNFLNVFATPLSVGEYIGGLVLSSVATSAVGLLVMLGLATTVFTLSFSKYGLLLFPFLIVLFLFGIALGIAACALVLRLGPAAEWFVWPIPAVLSPFAGVFYPLSTLPEWMQHVSRLLPPAYVFEAIRTSLAGGSTSGGTMGIAVALALTYVVLACALFVRVFRSALRSGQIAKYSAEV